MKYYIAYNKKEVYAMKQKKDKEKSLLKIEKFITNQENLKIDDKSFEKLMFIYNVAIKQLVTKIEILKDEFNMFQDYKLIDHIDTRIKTPKSIINKMEKRNLKLNYNNMVKNINDIAGVRIICPLKKDIFTIRNLIVNIDQINILKEKDYVTYPKKSGYSSYHLILEVPVSLSFQDVYVKVEVQIRTLAMDFWANLEHEMKYKPKEQINKKNSREWINCSKLIQKLDNKMMLLN